MPRMNERGIGAFAYVIVAFIAFIFVVVIAVLFPALFLAFLFFVAAAFVLYAYRGSKYGLVIGLVLLILAAVFGFLAVGNALSLSLVHGV